MTDYLCLTLLAEPGEDMAAFKARLATFWTHMIRNKPNEYERVFAEATEFGAEKDGRVSRQYMIEAGAIDAILAEIHASRIAHQPVDLDEAYSKYEASGPDWFQIDH